MGNKGLSWRTRRHPEGPRFHQRAEGYPLRERLAPCENARSSQTFRPAQWYKPRMREQKQFYVYIMTNNPRSAVLYTGITGDLVRRVWQHQNKFTPGFTSRYNLTRLVYYERFFYPEAAINREKEIKGWRRSKKIQLIESMIPRWEDLAKDWGNEYKPDPAAADQKEIPRPAGENAGLRDDATP